VLAYNNISAARQQFKQDERVHGVITNGGDKPNIIPSISESHYYVRAKNNKDCN
jgi:metal-dependent amidase/aminoacylase/carboxypeptidase family protein